jgi:hypothetical protein
VPGTPLRLGGFVMSSFAQFTDFSINQDGMMASGRVAGFPGLGQTAPHGWFIFGIRGRLEL